MYPEELVKPMREDLAGAGFEELHTSEAVNDALKKEGTTLVVVNSVLNGKYKGLISKQSFKQC